jgi:hypothetical protein
VSEQTIFDQNTNADQNIDPQPTGFTIPTEIEEFVGNGKKYQSVEDALKSVPHAQKHIQTLEQELGQLKEELTKRKTAAELLDEVKSGFLPETTPQVVELNQDKIVNMVNQAISQKELQKQSQLNVTTVTSKFKEAFGENAENVYNSLTKETGLSLLQLNTLAATSPNAVLKLAGLSNKKDTIPTKTSSSFNTESLRNQPSTDNLSARVPKGATTKDLVNAWRVAGEKVKQNISTS